MEWLKKTVQDSKLQFGLMFIFLCANTAFLIGDFNVRLANTSSDISPVAFSYYLKNPENYTPDKVMETQVPSFFGSMQNWLPYLLFRYFKFPPEASAFLLVYLQNVMLGTAMFHLALTITKRRDVAWLSMVFLLAFRPNWWNLALYADLDWMPYAGHLALPFSIYAFLFAIEKKTNRMILFLMISGLFHPGIALYSIAMVGIYELCLYIKRAISTKSFYLISIFLVVALFVSILPTKLATWNLKEVPSDQIIALLMLNGHTVPWANPACTYCLSSLLKGLIVLLLLLGLAWLGIKRLNFSEEASTFWKTSLVACATLCLVHPLAVQFQIIAIIRLITFRSTELMIVISLPFVIAYLIEKFESSDFGFRMIVVYILLMPSSVLMLIALIVFSGSELRNFWKSEKYQIYLRFIGVMGYSILAIIILLGIPFYSRILSSLVSPIVVSPLDVYTVPYLENLGYLFIVLLITCLSVWAGLSKNKENNNNDFRLVIDKLGTSLLGLGFVVIGLASILSSQNFFRIHSFDLVWGHVLDVVIGFVSYSIGCALLINPQRLFEFLVTSAQRNGMLSKLFLRVKKIYFDIVEGLHSRVKRSAVYYESAIPLIFVLALFTLTNNYQNGVTATNGAARAYYELQLWAKKYTPVNAGFIQTDTSTYNGWRSVSQRPVVAPFELAGYYFYSQAAWQYRGRLIDFFSRYCDFNQEPYRSYDGSYECYKTLSETGLLKFGESFGAIYLVKKTSDTPLQFPVIYQSNYYIVYKLKGNE